MTFDECHESLTRIRRRQGTRFPNLRVDRGGDILRGRLARTDSDPEHRRSPIESSGALVVEAIGASRGATTVIPIGEIPPGGLDDLDRAG